MIETTFYGEPVKIHSLVFESYNNDTLAVLANLEWGDNTPEEVPISVNLAHGQLKQSDELDASSEFFADVNNRKPIIDALEKNGWIIVTAVGAQSGHVWFPIAEVVLQIAIIEGDDPIQTMTGPDPYS